MKKNKDKANNTSKINKNYERKRNYLTMITENNINICHNEIEPTNKKKLKLNYKININPKYEINNLSYNKNIKKLDFSKSIEELESLNHNELQLYEILVNKIINEEIIFVRKIIPDGNCYFRSLSYFFSKNQNYY